MREGGRLSEVRAVSLTFTPPPSFFRTPPHVEIEGTDGRESFKRGEILYKFLKTLRNVLFWSRAGSLRLVGSRKFLPCSRRPIESTSSAHSASILCAACRCAQGLPWR